MFIWLYVLFLEDGMAEILLYSWGILAFWCLAGVLSFRYVSAIPQIRNDLISLIRANHEAIVKKAVSREGITEEEAREKYACFEQEARIIRVLSNLFCILGPFSYILVVVAKARKNYGP